MYPASRYPVAAPVVVALSILSIQCQASQAEEARGAAHTIHVTPDAPIAVEGEPPLILQVLLNLGANARDAMPGGGAIEIGVELCEEVHSEHFDGRPHAMF